MSDAAINRTKPIGMIARFAALPLLALIKFYQWLLSPFLGNACRFTPSCSHYGYAAIEAHGPLLGAWLASIPSTGRRSHAAISPADMAPCTSNPGAAQ